MSRLAQATRRCGAGELVSVEPVDGGAFGQNAFLTTSTGQYVLRGNPHTWWQFPTEQFYAGQLRAVGVPTPNPYVIDSRTDLFGWPYAILPRMPGQVISDGTTAAIAAALGRNLARMHRATWPHAGRYRASSRTVEPFDLETELAWWGDPSPGHRSRRVSWSERVVALIENNLHRASGHGSATTPADIDWAREIASRAVPAMIEPAPAGLVMQDYKDTNVTVVHESEGWRVAGVFDLMECYYGDPEADLPRQLCTYVDNDDRTLPVAFLNAYFAERPPNSGTAERFPAYLLLDRSAMWEFFQRQGWCFWPSQWTFSDWAGRYLELTLPVLRRAT